MPLKQARIVGTTLAFLGIWFLHVFWVCNHQPLNSDLLYLESLYTDFFVLGRPISRFIFTEAMFLFPDFALYAAIRPFAGNALAALIVYVAAFDLIFFGALYLAYSKVNNPKSSSWNFLLSLLTVVLLGLLAPDYRTIAFIPNYHGFLQILFLLIFVFLLSPKRSKLFLFALTFCVSFSDLLSIPTVFLPATLILASSKASRSQAFMVVAGFVSAYITNQTLIYTHTMVSLPFPYTFGEGYKSRMHITESLYYFPASLPGIFVRNAAVLIPAACVFWWFRIKPAQAAQILFIRLAVASVALTALAVMLMGRWDSIDANLRYIQNFFYLPILWLALFAFPQLNLTTKFLRLGMVLGLIALLLASAPWNPDLEALWQTPKITQCLDEHASKLPTPWGLGGYYISKIVTFTSSTKVYVNQVKRNFSAYPWMISPEWFREDIYSREIGEYTFMIARDTNEAQKAFSHWGPPRLQITCSENSPSAQPIIMIYPNGIRPEEWDLSPAD